MTTPATYSMNGVIFYCHNDNYLEGAALRLCNMVSMLTQYDPSYGLKDGSVYGDLAFAFIRGNFDAKPHDGVFYGGQHHYEVFFSDGVYGLKFFSAYTGDKNQTADWQKPLVDFINQQYAKHGNDDPSDWLANLQKVTAVTDNRHVYLAQVKTAKLLSQFFLKKALEYPDSNINKKNYSMRHVAWDKSAT